MIKPSLMRFDLDAQLEQIDTFTQQQHLEVKNLISSTQEKLSKAESESAVNKVEQEVSQILSAIESTLDEEMANINQQLQTMLPVEKK
ncbi:MULTISPECIES: hypothetical protein [Marinomonas]|uniref:hypothetical protein n=1 Tax=Marinomonas TaxID=28253 RepID=UPI0012E8899C|nr:hypothetical protein [Marinomonas sp. TW1]